MPGLTAPRDELWQGDIFSDALWITVQDLRFVHTLDGQRFEPCGPPDVGQRGQLVARAGRAAGILLTHECVIDKQDGQPIAFARVLELSRQRDSMQASIRQGRNYGAFYLPAGGGLGADHYADFRIITSLNPRHLASLTKIASLDDQMRAAMREMLARYWTRTEP